MFWFIVGRRLRLTIILLLLAVQATLADESDWAAALLAGSEGDYELAATKAAAVIASGQAPPEVYYRRGRWTFRLDRIDESLADFDRYLALRPSSAPQLWERGITCYYAGQFAAGARQFEQCQVVYSNDVENAVWRFLCQFRIEGLEKARQEMLPIKSDSRAPMMEVYALFRGQARPDVVLQRMRKAEGDDEASVQTRFLGRLYLGLYHDVLGDKAAARRHLQQALEQFKEGPYMWSVARIHLRHLDRNSQEAQAAEAPEK